MTGFDLDYYQRRAVDERIKADRAGDPATAQAHRGLAALYEERAEGLGQSGVLPAQFIRARQPA